MSYMAALTLVQEPVEAIAYATLVTLLQVCRVLVNSTNHLTSCQPRVEQLQTVLCRKRIQDHIK